MSSKAAILVLADGTVFEGISIGVDGATVGEVVFNTSMTGYQEMLTDPSYTQQILTLTYPHIGNTGTNDQDQESKNVYVAGLVIRDLPILASNWRMQQTLPEYLKANNVVAIADIDTRRLTRILREKGAQHGCIMTGKDINVEHAKAQAQAFAGLKGLDLAKEVTVAKSYMWTTGTWCCETNADRSYAEKDLAKHVVAYDFGIKHNILRLLVEHGCKVTVVPAKTSAETVLAMKPDGVFLSNGPGDPEPCDYAIAATKSFLERKIPVFGICLGHQILALSAGAKTVKMKFGHHGANHPVQDLDTKQVMITTQNHGFAVDEKTLPDNVRATHRSLFDKSLQGIELIDAPAFSFQGHPEASAGPHDVRPLFEKFIQLMEA